MTNDTKQPPQQSQATPEAAAKSPSNDPVSAADLRAAVDQDIAAQEAADQEPQSGEENVEGLLGELADLKDSYIRLAADMDNLRKRTEREKKDIAKYAISDFARDILGLSDNFQRAIASVPAEAAARDEALKSFLEGVEMNERELQKVLERHGVQQLNPAGEKFDPNMHQAVQQVDNGELPHNTVCDVFQVGYMIADRVLRPAVVSVAKGGPKTAPEATAPTEPRSQEQAQAPEAAEPAAQEPGSTIDKNA